MNGPGRMRWPGGPGFDCTARRARSIAVLEHAGAEAGLKQSVGAVDSEHRKTDRSSG
jgi:hypothetical protein